MATYSAKVLVEYQFEVEADTDEEAERLAEEYAYWDDDTAYSGMYSCEVEEDFDSRPEEDEEV